MTPGSWHRLGLAFLIVGVLLIALGPLLQQSRAWEWFGRLPGDIRIDRGNFRLRVPIVSSLLLSLLLTIILNLWWRR